MWRELDAPSVDSGAVLASPFLVDVVVRLQRPMGMLRRILKTYRDHTRENTQNRAHRTQYRRGVDGQNTRTHWNTHTQGSPRPVGGLLF